MKKSWKGALLSGLVIPGAGQLWLKSYLRGIVLIVLVTASLAALVMRAVSQALALLEKAEIGGGAVDLVALANAASRASARVQDPLTRSALLLLVLCWVLGMVDAYLTGKKLDRAERGKEQRQTAASRPEKEE